MADYPKITVIIPVGPNPAYLEWLPLAIESVLNQTYKADEIFILRDGRFPFKLKDYISIDEENYYNSWCDWCCKRKYTHKTNFSETYSIYLAPIRFGVATIFNIGVALADNNCVFMMGSDDMLYPSCLEECAKEYVRQNGKDAWYNVTIRTQSGEESWIPNHAAMVTNGLFEWFQHGNGYYGFPPASGVGGPDALLLSILMKHAPDKIVQVLQKTPLYWVREHEHQMTKQDAGFYSGIMESVRNKETERFKVEK